MARHIQCRVREGRDDDIDNALNSIPNNIDISEVVREALRFYFFNVKPRLLNKINLINQEDIVTEHEIKPPEPPPINNNISVKIDFNDVVLDKAKNNSEDKLSKLLDNY